MGHGVLSKGRGTAVAGGGGDGQQGPLSSAADGGGGEGAIAVDVGVDQRSGGLSLREGGRRRVPGESAHIGARVRNSPPGHSRRGVRRLFPVLAAGFSHDADSGDGGGRFRGQSESFQRPGTHFPVGLGRVSAWFKKKKREDMSPKIYYNILKNVSMQKKPNKPEGSAFDLQSRG